MIKKKKKELEKLNRKKKWWQTKEKNENNTANKNMTGWRVFVAIGQGMLANWTRTRKTTTTTTKS